MDDERQQAELQELRERFRRAFEERVTTRDVMGAPEPSGAMLLAIRAQQQLHLRLVMERMGFEERDVEEACESVHVKVVADDAIIATFDVPERVEAYFAAVRHGDFERATMLLATRGEG
jgi:hypothetical protein